MSGENTTVSTASLCPGMASTFFLPGTSHRRKTWSLPAVTARLPSGDRARREWPAWFRVKRLQPLPGPHVPGANQPILVDADQALAVGAQAQGAEELLGADLQRSPAPAVAAPEGDDLVPRRGGHAATVGCKTRGPDWAGVPRFMLFAAGQVPGAQPVVAARGDQPVSRGREETAPKPPWDAAAEADPPEPAHPRAAGSQR